MILEHPIGEKGGGVKTHLLFIEARPLPTKKAQQSAGKMGNRRAQPFF
ncbi:MAG: hypothetical protein SPF51_03345 [Candidatus Fimivicinus sp.]|nr:hypothetical protein [Oscillospiraceae bacterium]MDY5590561.1 hypothetical protein [Candidatus Fimivicinus sp.]